MLASAKAYMLASTHPMPRSRDPFKYPTSFFALLDKVAEAGSISIPHPHPTSFRSHLQAFLSAVETSNHPKAELAKSTMVRKTPEGVEVCDRDRSPHALAVAAALGDASPSDAIAEAQARLLAFTKP